MSSVAMSQVRSSPRGAPHSGFSRLILRTSSRVSFQIGGRPGGPRRTLQVRKSRKPFRCQAMTVSGFTITTADRQSAQAGSARPTATGRTRSTGFPVTGSSARRACLDGFAVCLGGKAWYD